SRCGIVRSVEDNKRPFAQDLQSTRPLDTLETVADGGGWHLEGRHPPVQGVQRGDRGGGVVALVRAEQAQPRPEWVDPGTWRRRLDNNWSTGVVRVLGGPTPIATDLLEMGA